MGTGTGTETKKRGQGIKMGLGIGTEEERSVEMEMSMSWRLEWAGIQTGRKIWTRLEMQKVGTRLEHLWVQGETGA